MFTQNFVELCNVKRQSRLAFMGLLLVAVVFGCSQPGSSPPAQTKVAVTGVTVSPETDSVNTTGGYVYVQLGYTISPANATNQGVTWSSNNGLLGVSSSGYVTITFLLGGQIRVTATTDDGSFTDSCLFTCNNGR